MHKIIYGVLSVHVVRGRKHYHKRQVVVTKPVSFRLELQQHLCNALSQPLASYTYK